MKRRPDQGRMVVFDKRGERYAVQPDRLLEAQLRRRGRYRELVLRQIRGGRDPSREDLSRALLEHDSPASRSRVTALPDGSVAISREPYAGTEAESADRAELLTYVAKTYVSATRPQRPGPKSSRSLEDELAIARAYFEARAELLAARNGIDDVRAITEEARRRAAQHASKAISTKTVKRIVDGLLIGERTK